MRRSCIGVAVVSLLVWALPGATAAEKRGCTISLVNDDRIQGKVVKIDGAPDWRAVAPTLNSRTLGRSSSRGKT